MAELWRNIPMAFAERAERVPIATQPSIMPTAAEAREAAMHMRGTNPRI